MYYELAVIFLNSEVAQDVEQAFTYFIKVITGEATVEFDKNKRLLLEKSLNNAGVLLFRNERHSEALSYLLKVF